jgi:hypothetical protein
MNLFAKWRQRRLQKRSADLVIEMLIQYLESGGDLDDLFVLSVVEPVEWDMKGQFWFVGLKDELDREIIKVDKKVSLSSGRGGAVEEAMVVEDLGGGKFRLSFE